MSWHVDRDTLHRYQAGTVDRVTATSLEAHVTECANCRQELVVESQWLDRSWKAIAERVEPSQPSSVERILHRAGVPSHLAQVMTVTPSLRPSWLIAVTLTLLFASVAARVAPPGTLDLFLVVAPLIPVVGVAAAYGRLADPAHEVTVATPIDSFRLLLLRAAAVTGFAFLLSLVVDLFVVSTSGNGLWILPALALALVTLGLGTRLEMWKAAAVSAGGWFGLLAVLVATPEGGLGLISEAGIQLMFLGLAIAAALILAQGGDAYRRGTEK